MTDFIQVGKDVYQKVGTVSQQGSAKKAPAKPRTKPKPKTGWQSLTKRQRENVKAIVLLLTLGVQEIVCRGYGYAGLLTIIVESVQKLITG